VILPDINILIHAYNAGSSLHSAARDWWETALIDGEPVGLAWVVALGFIRLSTNPAVAAQPLPVSKACAIVESWLATSRVSFLHPGARHASILFDLLRRAGSGGNLTTDAHLAALALEHDVELCSTDSDFKLFPGLRWQNPLLGR